MKDITKISSLCTLINVTILTLGSLLIFTNTSFATVKINNDASKLEINDECQRDELIKNTQPPMSNLEIKDLQIWLRTNGFYHGKIDGVYGPETSFGIRKFQKVCDLNPDGIIGENTWEMIGQYPAIQTTQRIKPIAPRSQRTKIYVDIVNKKLILQIDNIPIKTYNVAVGKFYTPTPIGHWEITRKAKDWGTGFGTRWLGFNVNWGMFGIHGTNKPWSVGRAASHGCVRMANSQVEELYEYIQPGNQVLIYGNPFGPLHKPIRVLMRGEKGSDVVEIQKQLKRLGYLHGEIDGIFGLASEKAVKAMQKEMKVEVTAQIRELEYERLGFGKIKALRINEKVEEE